MRPSYAELRPLLRSLLQKCVRRGYGQLAQATATRLAEIGDSEWLATRVGVIAFEECWPHGAQLRDQLPLVSLYEMACLAKNKEAAGLGALAQSLSEGYMSVLDVAPDPVAVKIVAASLTRPADFFSWAEGKAREKENLELVRIAKTYFAKASWPWDKAFASAASYFACVNQEMVKMRVATVLDAPPSFPFWVAIDKHTPTGRTALRRTAKEMGVSADQLGWVSFYFESSVCNELTAGVWWEAEMSWRLGRCNLVFSDAEGLWLNAKELVRREVAASAEKLEVALGTTWW